MFESITDIRQLNPCNPDTRRKVEAYLANAGLRLDEDICHFAGMFDEDDNMIGCGGIDGNVIKCLALSPEARGEGASTRLISYLMNEVFNSGSPNARVFTKPEYKNLFKSLGFHLCGEGSAAVLLESDTMPLKKYTSYLSRHKADGVIVANTDPVTLGHLHLITKAAAQCRRLAVIAVGQNKKNMFRYPFRLAMLRKATAHLSNVEILEASEYVISRLAFPSYFIKKADDISRSQAELDLDIFCRHIAPALGCTRRFVGTEPLDLLTSQYNSLMKTILPERGVEVIETERLCDESGPVSASRVRRYLSEGRLEKALALVPATDTPYFLASLALKALKDELELAPKPGLVDPYDSGSHSDMDYLLMSASIESLHNYFVNLATFAFESAVIDTETLRSMGIQAEKQMLDATGGINTHRGAIFSMGLAVAAASRILSGRSHRSLSEEIASLCKDFSAPRATHGYEVRTGFGISGALDNAKAGYPLLFRSWLPFYRQSGRNCEDRLRLLMKIISELDDSNAIFRAGPVKAREAREKAAALAGSGCTPQALDRLNEEFKRDRISHGGAADMLALTFFIDSITITTQ